MSFAGPELPVGHFLTVAVSDSSTPRQAVSAINTVMPMLLESAESFKTAMIERSTIERAPLDAETKEALLRLYSAQSKKVHASNMRASITQNPNNPFRTCPYCTLVPGKDIDHFAPKAGFPELAVEPSNLVPICPECNRLKATTWIADTGARFWHPYFDEPVVDRFLWCELSTVSDEMIARYSISAPPTLSSTIWDGLELQFARLDLANRFSEAASDLLSHDTNAAHTNFLRGGREGVQEWSEERYESSVDDHGINHWRSAMFFALVSDPSHHFGETRKPRFVRDAIY
jgi:hypothetical protein